MKHLLIVKLNEGVKVSEYLELAEPYFKKMVDEIDGFIKYNIILNKVKGANNFDIMVEMIFENENVINLYKPNHLHKELKENTEHLVLKKAIFDL